MASPAPLPPTLVLASASPFRRRMLEDAGLAFRVVPADLNEAVVKERLLVGGMHPVGIAEALAKAKAQVVSAAMPEALTIGSDQVLALENTLLNKPADVREARAQLQALRGKTHTLHTAVALAVGGKTVWQHVQNATLAMRTFSDASLDRYLREVGDRVCRTVGGYEIEGPAIQLFERIEGDMFTIIGLPLLPLLAELRRRGAVQT